MPKFQRSKFPQREEFLTFGCSRFSIVEIGILAASFLTGVTFFSSFSVSADDNSNSSCLIHLVSQFDELDPEADDATQAIDTVVAEYAALGTMSPLEQQVLRGALQIEPLINNGLFYRASAEYFYNTGISDPTQLKNVLSGFKIVSKFERMAAVNGIFENMRRISGIHLSVSDLQRLDEIARGLGMTVREYIQLCTESRKVMEAKPEEIKFAIFVRLMKSDDSLADSMESQYKYRKYFGSQGTSLLASNGTPLGAQIVTTERIGVNIKVLVKKRHFLPNKTQKIQIRVHRQLIDWNAAKEFGLGIKWSNHEFRKEYILQLFSSVPPESMTFDDLLYLADVFKEYRDWEDGGDWKIYNEVLFIKLLIQKLNSHLTHEQAQLFLSYTGGPKVKIRFIEFLRSQYPDDPYYKNLVAQ